MRLVLASQSQARRAMLEAARLDFDVITAGVDEDAAKTGLRAEGIGARNLADALAELKALRVSGRRADALVIGSDQTLALDDGTMLDKPDSRGESAAQLRRLSGTTHSLYSAVVIAENGRTVWRHIDRARLSMRVLSESFIESYLDREYDQIAGCVGCYRIEGMGAQLFARIEGNHFTILGLPLLPLLDYLRTREMIAA